MDKLKEAFTFDDVLIVPAYSEVLPSETNLKTHLSREIELNIPIVSAAMDTVSEAELAIALAQEGGIGMLHKNMTVESQAAEVRKVKKYESGIINDPITVSPKMPINDVIKLTEKHKISGVPVVDNRDLIGIVTHRDLRFETRLDAPVSSVMTPKDKLITVKEGAEKSEVKYLLHKHRIEKVLVVNDDFELRGMITVKDFQKSSDFPNASKDSQGRLRTGAAIGVGTDADLRVEALAEVEVDVILIDTAHGYSKTVLTQLKKVKQRYPDIQVIVGNVVSAEAAKALVKQGADGVKVGIGPGSICTTRIVAGVGVPQLTAINHVSKALAGTGVPVIADGGIRFSGDAAKALVAGADVVMIGSLLAGTLESPGDIEIFQGRSYKTYRGMGSLASMQKGSADRYFQSHSSEDENKLVPEGIEGRVSYQGTVAEVIFQLVGGIRASMGYAGCCDIATMKSKPSFIRITQAGMKESHAHSVFITKEAPNYHVDD